MFTFGPVLALTAVLAQPLVPAWTLIRPVESLPSPPSVELIEQRLSEVEGSSTLSNADRTAAIAAYREAIDAIRAAAATQRLAEQQYREDPTATASLQAELRASLERPVQEPAIQAGGLSLTDLELRLQVSSTELASVKEQLAELETEPSRRQERRQQIPDELVQLRSTLDGLADGAEQLRQVGDLPPEVRSAREASLYARHAATRATVASVELESKFYEQRREVLPLKTQRLRREITRLTGIEQLWQAAVASERRRQAGDMVRRAEAQLKSAPDALRSVAERNLEYAKDRVRRREDSPSLVERIVTLEKEVIALRARFEAGRARERRARDRTKTLGGEAGAQLLASELRALPDLGELRRSLQRIGQEIRPTQSRYLEIEELLMSTSELDSGVAALVGSDGGGASGTNVAMRATAQDMIDLRDELFRRLAEDYGRHLDLLVENSAIQREMIDRAEKFTVFINDHLIWVQHDRVLRPDDTVKVVTQLSKTYASSHWVELANSVVVRRFAPLMRLVTFLVAILVAIGFRQVLRRRLDRFNKLASSWQTDAYSHTVRALVDVLGIAALGAILFWIGAWVIDSSPTDLSTPVARGLRMASMPLMVTSAVVWLTRNKGLAAVHFRWNKAARLSLRRHTQWLRWALVPTVFLLGSYGRSTEASDVLVERCLRILFLVEIGLFLGILLRPRGPALAALERGIQNRWFPRLRYVLYGVVVALPLALALLVVLGYTYTSGQLEDGFFGTLYLVVGLLLLHTLTLRWLFVTRRRIAIEQAKTLRQSAREADADADSSLDLLEIKEPIVDLAAMDQQTRKLLKSTVGFALLLGFWFIWEDVLPALRVFDSFTLWTSQVALADGTLANEDITLANLLLALVVVVISLLAARDVPGLFEIAILQRLPLQPGSRYAIITLSRYAITVVGFVMAFGWLGMSWSKIQWLIAAMTVGLGFGLQEIFANFVSGIIILFERPVRVGDIVTIGDVNGKVTQLRIRATTVTNFDRKELLVPNKEFITGRLINWTLTDSILRMVIPVGINYGSDKQLAQKVLMDTALANARVLREPAPQALLTGFGNDSVNFDVRVYLPSPDAIPEVRHELVGAIETNLNAHGIEISFPQRDLHLRSIDPIVSSALRSASPPPDEGDPVGDTKTR